MFEKLIYLASPYSHPDPLVREQRFRSVCEEAGRLTQEGILVYSPIAHNHPVSEFFELPGDWGFWKPICEAMLRRCDELWVLDIPGVSESKGVRHELQFAIRRQMPVYYKKPGCQFLESYPDN